MGYSPDLEKDWERVLADVWDATLMHTRSYLGYHGDRFEDVSLLVYHLGKPVAALAAHRIQDQVYSHLGLGYAGLVCVQKLSVSKKIAVFKLILKHYAMIGIDRLYLRETPAFYGEFDQELFQYLLFLTAARLEKMELTFVLVQPVNERQYAPGRKSKVRQARRNGIRVVETQDFESFWENLLKPNLWERHKVKPVHEHGQMAFLAARHPGKIRQFNAYQGDKILAGATIYETPIAVHAQYLATSAQGRESHALDYLVHVLITETYSHKTYFDFGHVNEEEGQKINSGLMHWKESFGARPYVQRHYSVAVKDWEKLEKRLFVFNQ